MSNKSKKGHIIKAGSHQTGQSNKSRDDMFKALLPGKRMSASGSIYYEYRKNRSDLEGDGYKPKTKTTQKVTVKKPLSVKKTATKKAKPIKKISVKKGTASKKVKQVKLTKPQVEMAADVKRESPKFEVLRGPGGAMYPPKPISPPQGTKDPFAFLISPSAIMGPDLKAEAYKQKQEDKATRYMDLAHKKRKEAASIRESSHAMVNGIPFGQPILSGSKGRRDRKLRDRSWDMIGKSIKVGETADYYEQKAKNAANPKGISSDDPTAIAQLKRKIDGAKQTQENMKAVNKIAKSKKKGYTIEEKVNDIMGLGYSRHDAIGYMKEDYAGRVGCPSYLLTNNNANIRRMEQRIKELESQKNDVTKKMTIKGVKVVDDVQDNRLRVFFDDKPDATVRSKLKSSGFRWSPSVGAWQSYRGDKYMARLKEIL